MKSHFILIIFILYIFRFYCKNIVFPLKKLTIEYLDESKSIGDFIDYALYTNISVGTPPKTVGHFLCGSPNDLFLFGSMKIQYHRSTIFNEKEKKIEEALNIDYDSENSTSHENVDTFDGIHSDMFLLNDLTGMEYNIRLKFKQINKIVKNSYGSFDLFSQYSYGEDSVYLIPLLKENGLITGYYFTFIYEKNYTYLDDDYTKIFGNLIIGEAPHEFNPDLYSKDDEIKINAKYYLSVDEIRMNSQISDYSEKSVNIYIRFHDGFIKGSPDYRKEIEKIFFSELISKKYCKVDYAEENLYISQDFVYSCVNNNYMQEKIKHFPTLYIDIKQYNLTFLFNYQELFQLYNDRLYFLIAFKNVTYSISWYFGELFLRKYISSFNYDSKTISFYKKQVDDINSKTDIHIDPEDSDEYITDSPSTDKTDTTTDTITDTTTDDSTDYHGGDSTDEPHSDTSTDSKTDESNKEDNYTGKVIRIVIEVVMGIIIVVVVTILIIKYTNQRKKRANELKDEYDYIPDDKIN